MSNDEYSAISGSGTEVGERLKIADSLVRAEARVEIKAKMAAGNSTHGSVPTGDELSLLQGHALE